MLRGAKVQTVFAYGPTLRSRIHQTLLCSPVLLIAVGLGTKKSSRQYSEALVWLEAIVFQNAGRVLHGCMHYIKQLARILGPLANPEPGVSSRLVE